MCLHFVITLLGLCFVTLYLMSFFGKKNVWKTQVHYVRVPTNISVEELRYYAHSCYLYDNNYGYYNLFKDYNDGNETVKLEIRYRITRND